MIIYIDNEFRCHTAHDGTMTAIETDFFDGKCAAFVEGYRFVPAGESWTRADGVAFEGEMVTAWKPFAELDAAQREYERQQYESARAAYDALNEGLTSV